MLPRQQMGSAHTSRGPVRERVRSFSRRLAHFLFVWSVLLLIHEHGHAWTAKRQGYAVDEIIVGAGPTLWSGSIAGTAYSFRVVPIVGATRIRSFDRAGSTNTLTSRGIVYGAGILWTMAFALLVVAVSAAWEVTRGTRCVWGRMIIADAIVLSILNCLPVPPLDGGRMMFAALTAWKGSPFSSDAMFWMQLGGLALAIAPMTLWTRWTARIDAIVMWWRVPRSGRPTG